MIEIACLKQTNFKLQSVIAHEKQCKICLQSDQGLIRPCSCKGKTAYAHKECLIQWISTKKHKKEQFQVQNSLGYESINCQICLDYITIKTQKKRVCNTCDEIHREIKIHKKEFLIKTLIIILIVFIFAVLLFFLIKFSIPRNNSQSNSNVPSNSTTNTSQSDVSPSLFLLKQDIKKSLRIVLSILLVIDLIVLLKYTWQVYSKFLSRTIKFITDVKANPANQQDYQLQQLEQGSTVAPILKIENDKKASSAQS